MRAATTVQAAAAPDTAARKTTWVPVPQMPSGMPSITGLAVMLGVPDGIWGTGTQVIFLATVAGAAAACTVAAALIAARRPPGPR